jgi:hypothetical protein
MAQLPRGGEDKLSSSSKLTGNDSHTIQCITTPCKYPTSQAMPPEPEIDKTVALPAPNGTKPVNPGESSNNDSQTEPCISPCPPGQVCIQICKPIGQPETKITTTPPPSPTTTTTPPNEQQASTPTTSPEPDETISDNGEEPQDEDDADTDDRTQSMIGQ